MMSATTARTRSFHSDRSNTGRSSIFRRLAADSNVDRRAACHEVRGDRGHASRPQRAGGRGAAWTEERATKDRATREGGAPTAPRRRAGKHSEPEGRGAAWTEERATEDRATKDRAT